MSTLTGRSMKVLVWIGSAPRSGQWMIPVSEINKLLEPFFIVDATPTFSQNGSLALSYFSSLMSEL